MVSSIYDDPNLDDYDLLEDVEIDSSVFKTIYQSATTEEANGLLPGNYIIIGNEYE
jgi:hypothetical protein